MSVLHALEQAIAKLSADQKAKLRGLLAENIPLKEFRRIAAAIVLAAQRSADAEYQHQPFGQVPCSGRTGGSLGSRWCVYRFVFKSEQVKDDFNRGLAKLKEDGDYDKIFRKYEHLNNLYPDS